MIFASSTAFSQQDIQNELSNKNSLLSEVIISGETAEYSFEDDLKSRHEDMMSTSKGFMPADDFENDETANSASLRFTLLNPGFVSIKIYDKTGKSIDEITKSNFGRGNHVVKWNRSKFSNGSYYYSIVTSEFSKTGKIQ